MPQDSTTLGDAARLTPRTLRCANGALYVLLALGAAAAGIWAACSGRLAVPLWVMVVCCAAALIWAAYYATYSYRVETDGVVRSLFFIRQKRSWADMSRAAVYRHDERGIATCRVMLQFADGGCWCISSEVFAPDDVQDFAQEMLTCGLAVHTEDASAQ